MMVSLLDYTKHLGYKVLNFMHFSWSPEKVKKHFFSSSCTNFMKSIYYTFWRNFSTLFYRCWWTKQESYQGYPRPIWQNSPCCRSPTMRIQEVRRSRSQGQIPKVLPLRLYWLYFEFQLWCGNKNKSVWRKPTYTVCKLKNFSATQILRETIFG